MPRYETRIIKTQDGADFQCACGFDSSGWPSEELAQARGLEHVAEHETGEPARELVEFRAEHGLNGETVEFIGFDTEASTESTEASA